MPTTWATALDAHFNAHRCLSIKKADPLDPLRWNVLRGHSTPTSHLGDKADFTPSPLIGSGSNRGCLTGETYDVVRSYGICSYRAGFSHPPYAPSKPLQPRRENGAERNRTAVRNTGVDHLVRSRTDLTILASRPTDFAS